MRRSSRRSRAAPRALLGAALALAFACARPAPPPEAPPPPPVVEPEPPAPVVCPRVVHLEVRKAERTLVAECAGGGRISFPIALSRGDGPKRARGDERMPEGRYRVAGPARRSRFHLFIPIDYPSRVDADRALAEGRIDAAVHAAIVRAHRAGRMPPQDTPLGGHLGLHGEGARWRGELALDWTEGCIALADRDIARLARLVRPGTPIEILAADPAVPAQPADWAD